MVEVGGRVTLHLQLVRFEHLQRTFQSDRIGDTTTEDNGTRNILVLLGKLYDFCRILIKEFRYLVVYVRQILKELHVTGPFSCDGSKEHHLGGEGLGRCDACFKSAVAEEVVLCGLRHRGFQVVCNGNGDGTFFVCALQHFQHVLRFTGLGHTDHKHSLQMDARTVFGKYRRRTQRARETCQNRKQILCVYAGVVRGTSCGEIDPVYTGILCFLYDCVHGGHIVAENLRERSRLFTNFFFEIDHTYIPSFTKFTFLHIKPSDLMMKIPKKMVRMQRNVVSRSICAASSPSFPIFFAII